MTPLEDLQWHWGSAYEISVDAAGKYVAVSRDGKGRVLAAPSEHELRILIRADYRRLSQSLTNGAQTPPVALVM